MAKRPVRSTENETQPLYEVIYGVLREHIEDGSLPAGLVLGEAQVARVFNASRVPAGAALKRLLRDRLVRDYPGRGYLAGADSASAPIRLDLAEAGLRLPEGITGDLRLRNRRERIYPEVEHTVAACLSYGRFMLNESALADFHGVSRTVAHEVLTRLERAGLVTQDANQRWYAGPLTKDLLREHYEMRWLLEPIALGQAHAELSVEDLQAKHDRVDHARHGRRRRPASLERLENDLHVDTVLRCHNTQLRETIRRSQLPIIATHSTFERFQNAQEIATMMDEHLHIFGHLIAGRRAAAMAALEEHLRRSLDPNVAILERLGMSPEANLPPYLVRVDTR